MATCQVQRLSFLDLPWEIRQQIYVLLLQSSRALQTPGKYSEELWQMFPQITEAVHPQILATCSQIRSEATDWLYRNKLCFPDPRSMRKFLERIGETRAALVTRAVLYFCLCHLVKNDLQACFHLAPNLLSLTLCSEQRAHKEGSCGKWRYYQLLRTFLREHPTLQTAASMLSHGIIRPNPARTYYLSGMALRGPGMSLCKPEHVVNLDEAVHQFKRLCATAHVSAFRPIEYLDSIPPELIDCAGLREQRCLATQSIKQKTRRQHDGPAT